MSASSVSSAAADLEGKLNTFLTTLPSSKVRDVAVRMEAISKYDAQFAMLGWVTYVQ